MTEPLQQATPPAEPIIIERPNELKDKVGGSLDPALTARAEQAVAQMAGNFDTWLEDITTALAESRRDLSDIPLTKAATEKLYAQALEVKSLGETYGYPLITRFAHSLCRLLIRLEGEDTAPHILVDAHIDAIRAALRTGMKSADDKLGVALATELEQQVESLSQQRLS